VSEPEFSFHPSNARLLEGRRALVTGATSGIGRGTAVELAAHGAAVAINHRGKVDEARSMAQIIEAAGGRAVPVEMDVSVEDDVRHGFAEAHAALGGLDLLVNTAGTESAFELLDRARPQSGVGARCRMWRGRWPGSPPGRPSTSWAPRSSSTAG
jgi:glucose 1-dehydrogenase